MRLLADTHAALWLLADDRRLSANAKRLLLDDEVACFFSSASVWEVAIKRRLGKIEIAADFHKQLGRHGIASLPVYDHHATRVGDLPPHHRDPFDRLLVAQAQHEGLSILSADPHLRAYDVPVVW